MKITYENESHLSKALDYILETENEDFFQNPDESHVYYHALVFLYGLNEAKKILEEAKKDLE